MRCDTYKTESELEKEIAELEKEIRRLKADYALLKCENERLKRALGPAGPHGYRKSS